MDYSEKYHGRKVIKNSEKWVENEFDKWGRGVGIGIVVKSCFDLKEGELDIKWPSGSCFENIEEVLFLED